MSPEMIAPLLRRIETLDVVQLKRLRDLLNLGPQNPFLQAILQGHRETIGKTIDATRLKIPERCASEDQAQRLDSAYLNLELSLGDLLEKKVLNGWERLLGMIIPYVDQLIVDREEAAPRLTRVGGEHMPA